MAPPGIRGSDLDGTFANWTPTAAVLIAIIGMMIQQRRYGNKKLIDTAKTAAKEATEKLHQPDGVCADKFFPRVAGEVLSTKMDMVLEDVREIKKDVKLLVRNGSKPSGV